MPPKRKLVRKSSSVSTPADPATKKSRLADQSNLCSQRNLAEAKSGCDLIFNIFAYNIPKQIQESDLKKYFEPFEGEVQLLKGTRAAFVHFANPEMAARVLAIDNHTIDDERNLSFPVKACDNWLQTMPDSCPPTLLDLVDDTILHLLKFLPLKDKLALAGSHVRFVDPFQSHMKTRMRHIFDQKLQDQGLSAEEIRSFFRIIGEHFNALELRVLTKERDFTKRVSKYFEVAALNCPNIEYLSICRVWSDYLKALIPNLNKLRGLRLLQVKLNDDCFHALQKLPELTHLYLQSCDYSQARNLHLLTNLRKLSISTYYYSHINSVASTFESAISKMPNLYALSLQGRHSTKFLYNLPTLCKNIEILKLDELTTRFNLRSLSDLKKLRSLEFDSSDFSYVDLAAFVKTTQDQMTTLKIHNVDKFSGEYCKLIGQLSNLKTLHFQDFSEDSDDINDNDLRSLSVLQNLVELKIAGSAEITNNGLLEFIKKCRKLKWVNIRDTRIDNEFARQLLPLIKNERRPNGRITFLVDGSRMNEMNNFPADYNSNEMKKLVKFVFDEEFDPFNEGYDNFDDPFENDFKNIPGDYFFT